MTTITTLSKLVNLNLKGNLVLVTGCFDVLHLEHKKFLLAAKRQGDLLLVGLESDLRLRQLKGTNRPIHPINLRLTNLANLNIADYCFLLPKNFSKPSDHLSLINQIKPNILAISSHTPNLISKHRLMKSIGGTVKIVYPHNPKISSTKMLESTS